MKAKWKGIYWEVFIYPMDNLVVLKPIDNVHHQRKEMKLLVFNQLKGRGAIKIKEDKDESK